jgi:capsid protein
VTTFAGSTNHPLLASWVTWLEDQSWTWPAESTTLAARASWLGTNDPFAVALYQAHEQGTLGPLGPRLTSLYDPSPEQPGTDADTRALRRRINALTASTWAGKSLDAEGVRTRRDLEAALDWNAWHLGDGIAVRVSDSTRSRWRLIHPSRVANPGGVANSPTLRDGFALVEGRVVGLFVRDGDFRAFGVSTRKEQVTYVPLVAEDGTPNVIHKPGLRLPGMIRGVSRLSPLVIMLRQLAGVLESHVAAKRLQAIFGMIVEAEDADAWAEAKKGGNALTPDRFAVEGPLNMWVKAPGSAAIQFTDLKFNGADLADYLKICYKVCCATVQMPVDVVLCQMSEASLSSSRAGLDQFDRTNQTEQEAHIASVSSIIDQVAVRDAVVAGELDLDPVLASVGKYSRPPRYSTDILKDANTVKAMVEAGISKTTAYERVFGLSYEDEEELKHAEAEFSAAQRQAEPPEDSNGSDQTTGVVALFPRKSA